MSELPLALDDPCKQMVTGSVFCLLLVNLIKFAVGSLDGAGSGESGNLHFRSFLEHKKIPSITICYYHDHVLYLLGVKHHYSEISIKKNYTWRHIVGSRNTSYGLYLCISIYSAQRDLSSKATSTSM